MRKRIVLRQRLCAIGLLLALVSGLFSFNANSTKGSDVETAINTVNWQTFDVKSEKFYRYIRVYNGGNWFGNIAELKL